MFGVETNDVVMITRIQSGFHCVVDVCKPSQCLNGGFCRRRPNKDFSCGCRKGYSGKKCGKGECLLQISKLNVRRSFVCGVDLIL